MTLVARRGPFAWLGRLRVSHLALALPLLLADMGPHCGPVDDPPIQDTTDTTSASDASDNISGTSTGTSGDTLSTETRTPDSN